jgi:hypothetical protein
MTSARRAYLVTLIVASVTTISLVLSAYLFIAVARGMPFEVAVVGTAAGTMGAVAFLLGAYLWHMLQRLYRAIAKLQTLQGELAALPRSMTQERLLRVIGDPAE